MEDKELLKFAAKAAGYPIHTDAKWVGAGGGKPSLYMDNNGPKWNPLTDDGDAFRLMNDLEMRYGHNVMNDEYEAVANNLTHKFGASDKDPRRVIVLVAAAIGDAMP